MSQRMDAARAVEITMAAMKVGEDYCAGVVEVLVRRGIVSEPHRAEVELALFTAFGEGGAAIGELLRVVMEEPSDPPS